jgi:sensor histidine kinase regulating citrate/malate metabolism
VDIKSFINLPEDFLKNVDAVSIFGNILNNAIEACMEVRDEKSRFINIDLSQDPIDYVFQKTNSMPAV